MSSQYGELRSTSSELFKKLKVCPFSETRCRRRSTFLSYSESSVDCWNSQILAYLPAFSASVGGWPPSSLPRSSASENYIWAIMRHRLHDSMFSHFSRTPTCNKQTDKQTHDDIVLAWRCAVKKMVRCPAIVLWYRPTLHYTTTGGPFTFIRPRSWGSGVVCAGSEHMISTQSTR